MEMKNLWSRVSTRTKIGAVIALLLCGSLLYNWYSPDQPVAGVVTAAPVAKAVAHVDTKVIPATKLEVYDKEQVVKKVNLPEEVKTDKNKQVTSVSDVKPSKAGVIVTTVTDTSTGKTTAYQEVKKQPLLGWGGDIRVGADYVALGKPEVGVHLQYDFVRVGNVYGHVRTEVAQKLDPREKTEFKGMVGMEAVW